MQVSLENTANLERRMTVNVPATRLNEVVESRLQEIARTSNMKGFRKGKVPTKVIEQRFGQQVRAEAYGDLVRMTFGEAVREKNLFPAGTPNIVTTTAKPAASRQRPYASASRAAASSLRWGGSPITRASRC